MKYGSPRAVRNIMQNQFRLDDLLARDVVPQWFEGVAIIQLICRQLHGRGLENARFPRPEHILIAIGGSVTTTGESDERPVEAAAHVLGLMLGNDVPVRLRLSITQATVPDGYASLAQFSEALAYFERPNPEAIVESFRQRAMAAVRREVAPPPVRIETAPVREKQPAPSPVAARSGVSRLALIAATFAALACATIWLMGQKVANGQTATATTAEKAETEPPKTRTKNITTSAQQHNIIPLAAPVSPLVATRESAPRSVVESAPKLQVIATTLSYAYPESLPDAAIASLSATTQTDIVTADHAVLLDPTERVSDRIYSQSDSQVMVPVSVYPKLPNEPPGPRVAGRTLLELTIAADGLVERVRMLSAPRNIHEFMLVSAAKAWRFEPARLDGRPVRFRQTLALTPMP
jgi:hypothetical protein